MQNHVNAFVNKQRNIFLIELICQNTYIPIRLLVKMRLLCWDSLIFVNKLMTYDPPWFDILKFPRLKLLEHFYSDYVLKADIFLYCCAWSRNLEIYNFFIKSTFMPINENSYKIFDNFVELSTVKFHLSQKRISSMSSSKKCNVQLDKLRNNIISINDAYSKFLFKKNIIEIAKYLNIEDYMTTKFINKFM